MHLTLTLTTIFCRFQQTVQLLFNCRRSLNQSNSNKPPLQKRPKKCFKGIYITTMYFALCIVCCVVYCLLCITVLHCDNNQMQKMFQRKLYTTMYFVLCIVCCVVYCVCCVSQYCVVPTIKCKFFQQNLFYFFINTHKFILCKLLMFFSSDVGFSMSACSIRLM